MTLVAAKVMVPEVLVGIAMGRAELVEKNKAPPFIVHLPPKRALKLVAELKEMNVSFGVPFNGFVPDPKEDDNEWIYFGTVLSDVHVYARAR